MNIILIFNLLFLLSFADDSRPMDDENPLLNLALEQRVANLRQVCQTKIPEGKQFETIEANGKVLYCITDEISSESDIAKRNRELQQFIEMTMETLTESGTSIVETMMEVERKKAEGMQREAERNNPVNFQRLNNQAPARPVDDQYISPEGAAFLGGTK